MTGQSEKIKDDEEYLDIYFSKGDNRRGEAMVLMAKARMQGRLEREKEILEEIEKTKIIKDEFCICKHSKTSHLPTQLDKYGGRCMICVDCSIYTWKSFEFIDLKPLIAEIKGARK